MTPQVAPFTTEWKTATFLGSNGRGQERLTRSSIATRRLMLHPAHVRGFRLNGGPSALKLGLCALVEAKRSGTKSRKPASEKGVEEDCMSVFLPHILIETRLTFVSMHFGI